jgi:hypothetical protein
MHWMGLESLKSTHKVRIPLKLVSVCGVIRLPRVRSGVLIGGLGWVRHGIRVGAGNEERTSLAMAFTSTGNALTAVDTCYALGRLHWTHSDLRNTWAVTYSCGK